MRATRALAADLRAQVGQGAAPGARSRLDSAFAEEPVPLDVFVQDRQFLNNPPLSDIQYHVVRHLEQILLPETYTDMAEEFGDYWNPVRYINFAYVMWGKGSGKDHICRVAQSRAVYLLLCLRNPQGYFGMPPQDEIQTLNVASSATQAQRAFFRPFKTMIGASPWFADKFEPVEYSVRFDKQIESVSGHSQAETMEGLNLIFAIADEISAFKTKAEVEQYARTSGGREPQKTAESILKMMRTSARTRFPRNFKLAAISYPRFKGDAIQTLVARAAADQRERGEDSRMLASGPHPTWEVNPRISGPQDFREDYEEDPVMARTMYECKPEASSHRYFANDLAVQVAFSDIKPDPIEVSYRWGRDAEIEREAPQVAELRNGWQADFVFAPDFKPVPGALYTLHGDMALTGDRAGVAMTHVRRWLSDVAGPDEAALLPEVHVDFVFSFAADLSATPKRREIQIRWYRQLVRALMQRGFPVVSATFDRFQSADTMQILDLWGVRSERVSVDANDTAYATLRDLTYDGRLRGYYRQRLLDELHGLTRLPNGKVDHPPGGSKDEADALAGAVLGSLLAGGGEIAEGEMAPIALLAAADLSGWDQAFPEVDYALSGAPSLDPFGDLPDVAWDFTTEGIDW